MNFKSKIIINKHFLIKSFFPRKCKKVRKSYISPYSILIYQYNSHLQIYLNKKSRVSRRIQTTIAASLGWIYFGNRFLIQFQLHLQISLALRDRFNFTITQKKTVSMKYWSFSFFLLYLFFKVENSWYIYFFAQFF